MPAEANYKHLSGVKVVFFWRIRFFAIFTVLMSDRKEKRQVNGLPNSLPAHDSSKQFIPLALVQHAWVQFAQENRLHPYLIERFKQRLNEITV